ILDRIDKLRAERTNAHVKEYGLMEQIADDLQAVARQVKTLPESATPEQVAQAVLAAKVRGFSVEYWIRQGAMPDPEHPAFPADKGSLAAWVMALAQSQLGRSGIHTPDGYRDTTPLDQTHQED